MTEVTAMLTMLMKRRRKRRRSMEVNSFMLFAVSY
jgi:hypothetical protein